MERKFLEDLGLDKETIDKVLNQNSAEIGTHKNTIATLTTERDGLKTQLDTANGEIKSYKDMDVEGIKQKAGDWETKYNTDTQTLKDQLDAANYGFTVKEATAGLKFTSESARKAFVADLTAKKLPLQEGKLLGMEDFLKTYQTSDPGAFVPENDDKTPTFTKGTGGGAPIAADAALRSAFGLPDNSKKE